MRLVILLMGCVSTQYAAQVVARGELTLQNRDGLEMRAAGRRVARGLSWNGLDRYVGCVAEAREHAVAARHNGRASTALAVLGGTFGVLALGGLVGFADRDHLWQWLAGGVGSGTLGAIFAGTSHLLRNRANGHAVDAMNYYNDAVGSLGATCDDLRYPPSAGAAPPVPLEPPAPLEPPSPQ
jgi:hypothetical protein